VAALGIGVSILSPNVTVLMITYGVIGGFGMGLVSIFHRRYEFFLNKLIHDAVFPTHFSYHELFADQQSPEYISPELCYASMIRPAGLDPVG